MVVVPSCMSYQFSWQQRVNSFLLIGFANVIMEAGARTREAGASFCHISELSQLADGVPCLGFTTGSMSHAVVPKLIGNASKGNMCEILSPARHSGSYF